jgi:hypothetical protein
MGEHADLDDRVVAVTGAGEGSAWRPCECCWSTTRG